MGARCTGASEMLAEENYCDTLELRWPIRVVPQEDTLAGCSKCHPSKAAGSSATEAYPWGTLQGDGRLRTPLGAIFSILLGASIGTCDGLLENRAEAKVRDGIFEVGIESLEGSHVRVGDVFHREGDPFLPLAEGSH